MAAPNSNTTSVLIIDDDKRNIFALSLILKDRRYQCLSAADAATGIDMLRNNKTIDLVLLDMMMPETDGYETLAILKQDRALSRIPVVAVTAQAMPGDREKCIEAGADAYLSKPIDVDLMVETLNHLLGQ